ncbi:MAG TPA: tol-pal system-associated acyl-CoA thioesterase [Leucothrix mucor]|nr:tol-pal system-associated acyl-CoA thioesterase [Leucothrix mucor]
MTNNTTYSLPIRIYYEDTDVGGVVYHSNYLNFFERARTEWLRELGYEQDDLRLKENILFVVRNIDIAYLKPATFNDMVKATVEIKKLGRSSIEFFQQILRSSNQEENEVLAKGKVIIVCVDAIKFKPVKTPDSIRKAMV